MGFARNARLRILHVPADDSTNMQRTGEMVQACGTALRVCVVLALVASTACWTEEVADGSPAAAPEDPAGPGPRVTPALAERAAARGLEEPTAVDDDSQQAASGEGTDTPEETPEPVEVAFADEWEPIETFQGVPVETRREENRSGSVGRLSCFRRGADGNPVPHGPDWTFWANGLPREQQVWVDGKLDGPYRAWLPSGLLREAGQHVAGQREGRWIRYDKSGNPSTESFYRADMLDGPFRAWFPSGQLRESSTWKKGQLSGVERHWNGAGKLLRESGWLDGKKHGPWLEFFDLEGSPRLQGAHDLDRRVGVWIQWYPSGEKQLEETYVNDRRHGLQRKWRPDGSRESELDFADGEPDGLSRAWYPSGQLQQEGRVRAGKREGRWSYWRLDGTLNEAWSGIYEDDVKVAD